MQNSRRQSKFRSSSRLINYSKHKSSDDDINSSKKSKSGEKIEANRDINEPNTFHSKTLRPDMKLVNKLTTPTAALNDGVKEVRFDTFDCCSYSY